jgi:hypothetical protein
MNRTVTSPASISVSRLAALAIAVAFLLTNPAARSTDGAAVPSGHDANGSGNSLAGPPCGYTVLSTSPDPAASAYPA